MQYGDREVEERNQHERGKDRDPKSYPEQHPDQRFKVGHAPGEANFLRTYNSLEETPEVHGRASTRRIINPLDFSASPEHLTFRAPNLKSSGVT